VIEATARLRTLAEVEKAHVATTLLATNGNLSKAARSLGVDRRTLYRMLDRHGFREQRAKQQLARFPLLLETVRHYAEGVAVITERE
jgi:transposase-like protein